MQLPGSINRSIFALAATLAACGPARSTGPGGSGRDTDGGGPPGCPMLWLKTGTAGTVTVGNGALILDAPATATATSSIGVVQAGLSGDFSVTVQFDSFSASRAGGLGSFLAALGTTASVELGGDVLPSATIATYSSGPGATPVYQSLAGTPTSGSVTLARRGSTGSATVTVGGQSITQTGDLGTGFVSLTLTALPATSGADTVVHVTDIAVMDPSGTFRGDSFPCDSTY